MAQATETGTRTDERQDARPRRVQMELPQRSFDRLQALKEATEASSVTEVVKQALQLYEYLVRQDEAGMRFFLQPQGDAPMHEVKLFTAA